MAMTRMMFAGLLYLPFCFKYIKSVKKAELKYFFVVGIIGAAIPSVLFGLAQQKINSALSGSLSALTPLSTLILGILFFGANRSFYRILGIIIGFIGALMLVLGKQSTDTIANPSFAIFIFIATLMYAFSTNVIGKHLKHFAGMGISSVSFSLAFIFTLPLFIVSGVGQELYLGTLPWKALVPVFFLALISTVIGFVGYISLIKKTGPVFASTVNYLAPLVALVFGLLDGEKIYVVHLIGIVFLMFGIFLTKADP